MGGVWSEGKGEKRAEEEFGWHVEEGIVERNCGEDARDEI